MNSEPLLDRGMLMAPEIASTVRQY